MTTFISFIIVLGILIFVHEFGHFIVAKLSGVGVLKFSLGFGPRVIGIRRGETEYLLSALPFGGYVKMVGESPEEEIGEEEKARSFTHKSVSRRAIIVVAGPIMNLVLAFILLPIIYIIGIQIPAYLEGRPVIGYVLKDSAAERADLRKGDLVLSIDGEGIKDWEEMETTIASRPGRPLKVVIKRGEETLEKSFTPDVSPQTGAGSGGLLPPLRPAIGGISKGFPAEKAGLKAGDLILSIDGIKVDHWADVQQTLQGSGEERAILIRRGDRSMEVKVKPMWSDEARVYLIGISPHYEMALKRYGVMDATIQGIKRVTELTIFTFVVLKKLLIGELSIKALGGPLMIAQVAGQAAESGLTTLLSLMASLSLQLGILNLLPIPILDGGHLVFFGIEWLRGRPIGARKQEIAQQIGIALLVLLMVMVTYNDILRLLDH